MTNGSTSSACLLCGSVDTELYHQDHLREYFSCANCHLVFVPSKFHLTAETEKKEYDLHQNDIFDPHYRKFLSRLANPIFSRYRTKLSQGESIFHLDFGCGPGPALSQMFYEQGFDVSLFDIFYHNRPDNLKLLSCDEGAKAAFQLTSKATQADFGRYQVITLTEVLEHLGRPLFELERLWSLLKPSGVLGVMTKLVRDQAAFKTWHYKNDPTHIAFYSKDCLTWLASQLNAELIFLADDAFLLSKKSL